MRKLKVNNNDLKQLIADAVMKVTSGIKTLTLNVDTLLQLPKPEKNQRPTVVITNKAYRKMTALVDNTSKEIAWHGTVTRKDNVYIIEDVIVYPQKATATTVESDDDLYPIWLDDLDDKTFNTIRMQGHSHVRMGVTPSATDTDFYETLIQHVSDFYIFIIMNKSETLWVNIYDIANNVVYENTDIDVVTDQSKYKDWSIKQIEEHVQTHKATPTVTNVSTSGGFMTVEEYYNSFLQGGKHR